jgi:hypothetical protein
MFPLMCVVCDSVAIRVPANPPWHVLQPAVGALSQETVLSNGPFPEAVVKLALSKPELWQYRL